ncbi:HAMP domain-containing sensor histidine kinase [Paenibacillus turicensis]|uniref:sensor histidine kinase n=1 Tax=Paenibacillus turicensis TaxID=160487 RepID=UPI003D26FDE8
MNDTRKTKTKMKMNINKMNMNIKWKLTRKLISGLLVVGLILLIAAIMTLFWSNSKIRQIEAARQFESAGLSQLIETLQQDEGRIRFDPKLLELVKENGGWLQRIDQDGKVTDSYLVPPDVPSSYSPGQLTGYWLGTTPFPYQLYLWIQEKNGVMHTLLYGKKDEDRLLIEQLAERTKLGVEGALQLSSKDIDLLMLRKSWLQVLDEKGNEVTSYHKPEGVTRHFSLQELALRSVYPDKYGTKLNTYYQHNKGLTWVLSTPLNKAKPGQGPLIDPELAVLIAAVGTLIGFSMLVFALFAWWFGQRSGAPILHIMEWLKVLGKGQYIEPQKKTNYPHSADKNGKRKGNFAVYGEVLDSLNTLTYTLQRDAIVREETEQARNEWLAGVSHDLKTPLSSIKGYAHMLENKNYEWSQEEVQRFARVMLNKSNHMERLISDLTLEYQLQSGATPPYMEVVDLNIYLPEALTGAGISHDNQAANIIFCPAKAPVYLKIFKPWFQRIIDNLTANAFLHNQRDITLTVSVLAMDAGKIGLSFVDNGEGMDDLTKVRLFERYYRGTDTDSATEGSGLGMAIAKALVEVHGGRILVNSEQGKGTQIKLIWDHASSNSIS